MKKLKNELNGHVHSECCEHNAEHIHSENCGHIVESEHAHERKTECGHAYANVGRYEESMVVETKATRKAEKNMLVAFILNLVFTIFEFVGGFLTGSISLISDAVHDLGDASSIGLAFALEKKSRKNPDTTYTFGYMRYSVLGSAITTLILLLGSGIVIYNAVLRIINPVEIDYTGMIIFAVVGLVVNFVAALVTRKGESLNQKAVNLHMLEDVLGWLVVLVGAIIMKFTDISIIDPIMSIGVALFVAISAIKNLKSVLDVFLEKAPNDIRVAELSEHLKAIPGVLDIHHIHVWTMNGANHYATLHVVTDGDYIKIKDLVRAELSEHGICHCTLELESPDEPCPFYECLVEVKDLPHGHHHHHHH